MQVVEDFPGSETHGMRHRELAERPQSDSFFGFTATMKSWREDNGAGTKIRILHKEVAEKIAVNRVTSFP